MVVVVVVVEDDVLDDEGESKNKIHTFDVLMKENQSKFLPLYVCVVTA